MIYTVYETIESSRTFPVNIFVAPIENSTFHWHNEYEMIGILKGGIHIRVESELITLKEGDIFLVNLYRVFRRETGLTPNEFRHKGRLEQLEQYDEQLKGYLDYEVSEVKGALKKILE